MAYKFGLIILTLVSTSVMSQDTIAIKARKEMYTNAPVKKKDSTRYTSSICISINSGATAPIGIYNFNSGGSAGEGDYVNIFANFPISHSNYGVTLGIGTWSNTYHGNLFLNTNISGYYNCYYLMPGIYTNIPLNKQFSIELYVRAGLALIKQPTIAYHTPSNTDTTITSKTPQLEGGVNIEDYFSKHLFLQLQYDFLYSNITAHTIKNVGYEGRIFLNMAFAIGVGYRF